MYHFVTYNKKTGEITGSFRASDNQLLPKPLNEEDETVEVTDPEQLRALATMTPRDTRIVGSVDRGKIRVLKVEPRHRGRVVLTCDHKDQDGDGRPELPADGKTVAKITATLHDLKGNVLKEQLPVRFQVDRGALSRREVAAEAGVAVVEYRTVAETVRATITATAEGLERGRLEVDMLPEEEYRALPASDEPTPATAARRRQASR
jgi:hypothetical protein